MEGEGLRVEGGATPLVGGRADADHRGVAAHVLQPLHRLREGVSQVKNGNS